MKIYPINLSSTTFIFVLFCFTQNTFSTNNDNRDLNEEVLEVSIDITYANGNFCNDANFVCLENNTAVFPNSNQANGDLPNAETGPDYGCLLSQPFPSWFYLQIENSGDIAFLLEQNTDANFSGTSLDLDFKIWGPFSNPSGNCNNLNSTTEVQDTTDGNPLLLDGCSFSSSADEYMGIPNAQAGEYYIFITTNFSLQQGFVKISQINSTDPNAGSLACVDNSFLGDDITACSGDTVIVTATIDNADSYVWEKFNVSNNTFELISGEQSSTLSVSSPGGIYRSTVTSGSDVFQDEISVTFSEVPQVTPQPPLVACDDNSDFAVFDLTSVIPSIVGNSANTYDVIFYETEMDALANVFPIANPNSYSNISNPQTIYFRVENLSNTDCFAVEPLDLIVEECLSINDNILTAKDISIYPNPSQDGKIYIVSNKLANQESDLTIVDLNGKLVYKKAINYDSNGKVFINLNHLYSGIYMGVIKKNNDSVAMKIILN